MGLVVFFQMILVLMFIKLDTGVTWRYCTVLLVAVVLPGVL